MLESARDCLFAKQINPPADLRPKFRTDVFGVNEYGKASIGNAGLDIRSLVHILVYRYEF
jgi:hypothetical protein